MSEYAKGRIFKLSIGNDLKNYFVLGFDNKEIDSIIVDIIEDTNYLMKNGVNKYLIIVEDKKKVKWLWTEVVGLPHMIQHAKPINGQQENII